MTTETVTNEAAERLTLHAETAHTEECHRLERRATVERIRERVRATHRDSRNEVIYLNDLDRILDEEAQR